MADLFIFRPADHPAMLFEPIEIMPLPPNNLDQERWEKACIDELCKHGGSENDVRQLREHFRKIAEAENQFTQPEIPEI